MFTAHITQRCKVVHMYMLINNNIRPVTLSGYGPIAHEAKPNGLLTRGP